MGQATTNVTEDVEVSAAAAYTQLKIFSGGSYSVVIDKVNQWCKEKDKLLYAWKIFHETDGSIMIVVEYWVE